MKRLRLREEAERLNVSVDAVRKTFERSLSEGEILGIIDVSNEEFIRYDPEEMNSLVKRLRSERVSLQELANELNLKTDQIRLIISKLLQEKSIKGPHASDGAFVSEEVMRKTIIDFAERTGRIDVHELSKELLVSEEEISFLIEELGKQIINATAPYRQIGFSDLSSEVNLPKGFTIALLKRLISEGKIAGSLDMVNHILTVERAPKVTAEKPELKEQQITVSKPSSAWYFVPLFLGILGGIIAYLVVRDEDRNMANSMLIVGILSTFIGIIILLAVWGQIWIEFPRY